MAKKPETLFKERLFKNIIKRQLKNIYVRKLVAGSVGGIPDLLIIANGFCIMPELKMPGNNPTKLQDYNIVQINSAGGFSFPLYPEEEREFIDWIEELSLE